MYLGQNSKFSSFYRVKIRNFRLFIGSFCKRSSLRSQTFLSFRTLHLELVGTLCTKVANHFLSDNEVTSFSRRRTLPFGRKQFSLRDLLWPQRPNISLAYHPQIKGGVCKLGFAFTSGRPQRAMNKTVGTFLVSKKYFSLLDS